MSRRVLSALVLSLATAGSFVLGIGTAGPASAHAKLMSSTPANGAVVGPSTSALVLRFDDVVTLVPNAVRLTDGNGRPLAIGAPRVIRQRILRAALPHRLPGGAYVMRWRILADDGHIEDGMVSFRVRAGAGATSAAAALPPAPPAPGQPLWPVVAAGILAATAAMSGGLVVYRYLRATRPTPVPAYPDETFQPVPQRSASDIDQHIGLH